VPAEPDRWSRWVLERRDGGSQEQREATLAHLAAIRGRVLRNAEPLEGRTLLDVGAGDGLIGLKALDRVGPDGRVIFSDVSRALLECCRDAVRSREALDRAEFVTAAAEDLAGIPDESVDVATARSVLIYVVDKPAAFASLYRVLRPGGRISLFEPINRLMFPEPDGRFCGYDLSSVGELVARVRAIFTAGEPADRTAMMGFDDRDLAKLAEEAGFDSVHVECHIDIDRGGGDSPISLEALLDGAPNPNAPTAREAVDAALTAPEQAQFMTALAKAFKDRRTIRRMAVAYLSATKSA
jgi:arsenite methyltransferase